MNRGINMAQTNASTTSENENGSQEEGTLIAENFLGNGEKVTWAGLVEANNKIAINSFFIMV